MALPAILAGAKVIRAGAQYVQDRKTAAQEARKFRRDKKIQDKGLDMMQNPQGLTKGAVEAKRAGASQSIMGATRGLEAESRRAAAGARGGSALATQAMIAKARGDSTRSVEQALSDANLATQKFNVSRGAQLVDSVDPKEPTTTKFDAAMNFAGGVLGAGAQFADTKRKANLAKAALTAKGLKQTSKGDNSTADKTGENE